MNKLVRIRIVGFKDENRVIDVVFPEYNIAVIYGENGGGKSTFLRIINAIFDQQDTVLLNENVDKITITYSTEKGEKNIRIQRKEEKKEGDFIYIATTYDWSELEESELKDTSSILFGVNRGITNTINVTDTQIYKFISMNPRYIDCFQNRERMRLFSEDLARYLSFNRRRARSAYTVKDTIDFSNKVLSVDNISMDVVEEIILNRYRVAKHISTTRVQKALFDTLADACNSIEGEDIDIEDLGNLLIQNKEKLLSALRQIEENTLRDKIIDILQNKDTDKVIEECRKSKLLAKLIYKMTLELEKEEGILQSIRVLENVFNDHIQGEKYLDISENEISIKFRNKKLIHKIHDLSSGERHLLSLLTIFIIQGVYKDILMIDEPEISLNIKWQRKLLTTLSQLAPDSQIIVASHSPSISKANNKFLVELK
ncbi:AAA family ATPase [Cellulosilyticum sp. WCF-2]|uniref:AAA family ATPase n=1 Tax=Cellulosilyticum sp. WCF-2 TaxID=2497860 RepID=UPI000F8C6313|nr:AAA family ATPase [Cellulosilyticum sp. WCF-2]QEH70196.1 AAA family ATPase [Cellulosilyticum sp. WCF-2]